MEVWKDIKDYEGLYQVSDMGRVKILAKSWYSGKSNLVKHVGKEKIKALRKVPKGYVFTTLHKNGVSESCFIHRLVAEAFLPNPNNLPEVNHLFGIKDDNRVTELEWCTHSGNVLHAFRTGLKQASEYIKKPKFLTENGNAKKVIQLTISGEPIKEWDCVKLAADTLKIKQGNIANCARGRQHTAHGFKWEYAA